MPVMLAQVIPFSILDLSPVPQGATVADALANTLDLAQHAERWGYHRYWLAEHHNMPGIASAATAVVIGHVADGTATIRVGAGGIMLLNHAPLVIAEQFGTLASLHPGRIDLGLGRAPGTDPLTLQALRRAAADGDDFPDQLRELRGYFAPPQPGQRVRAVPGAGLDVPIWLLGSSLFSARLAADLGLPFAFAAHFAPGDLLEALAAYRDGFRPSAHLSRPYAMVGVNVLAAGTDAAARRLFTSQQQAFANLLRGVPSQVPPPIDDIDAYWTPAERAAAGRMLAFAVVGSPATVERGLRERIALTAADELILTGHVYDHADRLRSYELVNQVRLRLAAASQSR
jgi:luciferase family oxidoreductase group 1